MIDRIIIDNFKSIKHADVKLEKINLLIGPNNSGKSNFLKGISHLKKSIHGFHFSVLDDNMDNERTNLKVYFNKKLLVSSEEDSKSLADVFNSDKFDIDRQSIYDLSELLGDCLIYKPDFGKLSSPYPIFKNDAIVIEDASNIASFLQTCLNKYRKTFNEISAELKEVLPVFDEIVIDNIETEEIPNGKNKEAIKKTLIKIGIKDVAERVIWAEDLSEGALYFLALLCIIHQPNPPKVLLLEEPERSMHPRRIKEVIDLLRKLSDEKDIQVIMTTHSPLVVDLFENEPECIHVFEMKNGFTEIKNLKTDIIDVTNKELEEKGIDTNKDYNISLGDQWVYGLLGGVPA
ncbi:MAG: hypothetical protein JWQ09_2534 [Segetibacter sp.]|nr:hypothetical protein [Segetibacter sp.]